MFQMLLLITVPAVAFTAATAQTLVHFLLGSAWLAAAPIMAWLAIATGFAPLSISASWLFVSQDRAAEQTRFAVLRTALSIFVIIAGLPWGAVGVARSYAVFGLLVHGLPLWGATRRGPVAMTTVARTCGPFAVSGAMAILAVHVVEGHMQAIGQSMAFRLAGDALTAYIACGATLMCFPNGLKLLRDIWLLRSIFRTGALAGNVKPEVSGG
jgi:PST family polysaccharide transporter